MTAWDDPGQMPNMGGMDLRAWKLGSLSIHGLLGGLIFCVFALVIFAGAVVYYVRDLSTAHEKQYTTLHEQSERQSALIHEEHTLILGETRSHRATMECFIWVMADDKDRRHMIPPACWRP